VSETTTEADRQVWDFISANFHRDPRRRFLHLLGYDPEKVSEEVYIPFGDSTINIPTFSLMSILTNPGLPDIS
jgi:hypothetical protein